LCTLVYDFSNGINFYARKAANEEEWNAALAALTCEVKRATRLLDDEEHV
jgi:hypothetical protein